MEGDNRKTSGLVFEQAASDMERLQLQPGNF
jgi:hypothetical protein